MVKKGEKFPHTAEWDKRISLALKGRIVTEETRRRISQTLKAGYAEGRTREARDALEKKFKPQLWQGRENGPSCAVGPNLGASTLKPMEVGA